MTHICGTLTTNTTLGQRGPGEITTKEYSTPFQGLEFDEIPRTPLFWSGGGLRRMQSAYSKTRQCVLTYSRDYVYMHMQTISV